MTLCLWFHSMYHSHFFSFHITLAFSNINSSYMDILSHLSFVSWFCWDFCFFILTHEWINLCLILVKNGGTGKEMIYWRIVHKRYYDTGKDGVTAGIKLMAGWQHHRAIVWNSLWAVDIQKLLQDRKSLFWGIFICVSCIKVRSYKHNIFI